MTQQRVVVTGLGVISALGQHHAGFREGLFAGRSGIAPLQGVDPSALRFTQGAEVQGYQPDQYFSAEERLMLDRFAQFALIAAREAVSDAGLSPSALAGNQTAVMTGACMGGKSLKMKRIFVCMVKRNNAPIRLLFHAPWQVPGQPDCQRMENYRPVCTFSTACASSAHALGHAFWMIRQGTVQRAIAGGSEAPFSQGQLKAWEGLRIVSPGTCRPFSEQRQGMILGEGGAMLVLESLSAARARARIFMQK